MGKITARLFIYSALLLFSMHALAGKVTVPNTFVDGTKISAGEMNSNFTAVKSAVDDNDTRINTNKTDIQGNTSAINTNTTDITSNSGAITTNTGNISINATGIGSNASAITSNATNIQTNTSNINSNTSDILTNSSNINTNSSDIQTNAAAINTNAADIQTNTSAIDSIQGSKNISVFADGIRIGTFVFLIGTTQAYILSNNSYGAVMFLDGRGIPSETTYFLTPDCSGQSYKNGGSPYLKAQGFLYKTDDTSPIPYRYVPPNTPVETITHLSAYYNGSCSSTGQNLTNAYKSYPNDPNITGFQDADMNGTSITIGY